MCIFIITDVVHDLYTMTNERNQSRMPIISDFHYKIIMDNADRLNNAIKHERDSTYSYFGFKVFVKLIIICNIYVQFYVNFV